MSQRFKRLIKQHFQNEQYYDAQQTAKSLMERLLNNNDYNILLDLAEKYSTELSAKNEFELSIDLATQCLVYVNNLLPIPTLDVIVRFSKIFELNNNKECMNKYRFMNSLILWSRLLPENTDEEKQYGLALLHESIGLALINDQLYGSALTHFIICEKVDLMKLLIEKWKNECYKLEADAIISKVIMYILSSGKASLAIETINLYMDEINSTTPSMFLQLAYILCGCVKAKDVEIFEQVKSKYALVLRTDSDFAKLLSYIETQLNGCEPKSNGFNSFFNNFFSQLSV